ncbi:efflux RND transporter periplasmic adaptor subunit [Aquimonas voraii]|uniref:Membrane fusion protein, multidrug efflux system n=1 Tax=Aquimonas voraii TaxID=265719 RepID=A0A1G6WQ30_9GAMM|nr:efflux RND transporter periplasmic adaptor subunit [Aquimonas voraii]SDD67921.1 membrane fusion protein, multidrug efflux system [Aquimonas voraii]
MDTLSRASCAPAALIPALKLLALSLLLVGCSPEPNLPDPVRPAIVVQPQADEAGFSAYAGEVRARHEPALAFRVGGKISRRLVEVGERVARDQPLAELEPQDLGLQVEANRARLAAAESERALAQSEFTRQQSLRERGLTSASAFDGAQARLRAAESQVEAARAQLEVARNQAGYAVLRAPAAGVIAQRLAEAGQVVAAGQPVFVLAEDGEREVVIAIPEHAIADVSLDQPVQIQLWSQRERALSGRIRELAPAADAASRTYAASVAIADTTEGVELGQSARVFLNGASSAELKLPLGAVSASEGQAFVLRFEPASGTVHKRAVKLGAYGETSVPVLEGIGAQDWIVAGGVHLLRDGQAVRPVDRDNRPLDLAAGQ